MLVEAFFQIQAGRLALDERLPLRTADKNLPSGVLTFFEDGLTPTVRDLLTLMIIISDNTATDMMMKRLGVETITARMQALGLAHIHVPLTVRGIFNSMCPTPTPPRTFTSWKRKSSAPARATTAWPITWRRKTTPARRAR